MRAQLEKFQLGFYLIAILAGMLLGWQLEAWVAAWEVLLWPLLGLLLYATFTQVPMVHISGAFRDGRFMLALLVGNFLIIPLVVWLLLWLLPGKPAIQLGVLLVLLAPCTDWFISFTHLGKGDAGRAIAAAPLLLLGQLLLLPVYLGLFMGQQLFDLASSTHLIAAFAGLILLPLLLAWLTEKLAEKRAAIQRGVNFLGWLPVPLLASVVFLVAATQVNLVLESGGLLWRLLLVFSLFLLGALVIGWLLARFFSLAAPVGRTLIFSLGTRNSFVVLPLALALPDVWAVAVVVIVFQSLVELFGMLVFLYWVPRLKLLG